MKVCYGCNKPVPQCVCSQEKRITWEKNARAEKEEALQYIQKERQELKAQKDKMSEAEYKEELKNLEEDREEWLNEPEDYKDYSFEIDDDILDTILTLWDKGYKTKFCCAGHPDFPRYIYIVFEYGYYFDFTNSGFDDNWKYASGCHLCYSPSMKAIHQMEKEGMDPYEHLCEQRELLNHWVHQLPPPRKLKKGEKVKGIWMRHRRTKKEIEAAKAAAKAAEQ